MSTADFVEASHDFYWAQGHAIQGHRHTSIEIQRDVGWHVRRFVRGYSQHEHVLFWLSPGVFQDTAFMAEVPDVAVATVDGLFRHSHRHMVYARVLQLILSRAQVPLPPRGDDLQARVESLHAQIETHLVVALARAPVGHRICANLLCYFDQVLCENRPGKRRAQQIEPLIDRAGLHGREGVFTQELLTQVLDKDFTGSTGDGLLAQSEQFSLSLPQISCECDHFAIIVLFHPRHDHRRVQTSGICHHHLAELALHLASSSIRIENDQTENEKTRRGPSPHRAKRASPVWGWLNDLPQEQAAGA